MMSSLAIEFKFKCFIYPTEVYDIIYNLYVVHFWREGVQRSIAYRAVHLEKMLQKMLHRFQMNAVYMLKSYLHYRKISNIRRTKSTNLNASRLVLQLSLPSPMKPGVKSRMKM